MPSPHNKVLLVDDEERILSGLRRRLQSAFVIATATSGHAALNMIKDDPDIAVIVADMQMPEMNGIELLKEVKAAKPTIRRLMLTGNADQDTAIAAINEGEVMRFLRKPCETDVLKAALNDALAEFEFQTTDDAPPPAVSNQDQAEKAREAFLAMMSHELKTPLNQIIGFAGILNKYDPDANHPDFMEHLQAIQNSGENMLMLVSRILEFARLRSETQTEQGSSPAVDMVEAVQDEAASARAAAAKKDITISVDCLRRFAYAAANAADVRLAVRELIANAVKFSAAGGHISVSIKCDADTVSLRVADNGCGVDEAKVRQAVEPFRQSDEGYARAHEGVGIGLALVHAIADISGGGFALKSQPTGGAVATLVLPRAELDRARLEARAV